MKSLSYYGLVYVIWELFIVKTRIGTCRGVQTQFGHVAFSYTWQSGHPANKTVLFCCFHIFLMEGVAADSLTRLRVSLLPITPVWAPGDVLAILIHVSRGRVWEAKRSPVFSHSVHGSQNNTNWSRNCLTTKMSGR